MFDIDELISVGKLRADDALWLGAAEEGVDYLLEQTRSDETILFVTLECAIIQCALARRALVTPVDRED